MVVQENHSTEARREEKGPINIELSAERRKYLIGRGYRECVVQFYTTDGSVNDIELAKRILAPINGEAIVESARFEQPTLVNSVGMRVYSHPHFRVIETTELWLDYIIITFPYREKAPDHYYFGSKAGAIISLFFGIYAAKELHLQWTADLSQDSDQRAGPKYTVYPAASKLYRDLAEEFRSQVDISLAKPETITMLGLAKENESNPSYIPNLWQAIDAQTGDGKRRKKIISEIFTMEEVVSAGLNNVREARDNFFHDDIIPEISDKDIYVALSFLRICLVPPGPLRDSLVRAFETELANPTT